MRRAVFLDRDGVINRCAVRAGKPYAPRRLQDFRLLPHAAANIAALRRAGLLVIVVTNQPDIGNGLVDRRIIEAMHDALRRRAAPDDIRMCPHGQDAGCDCRKPKSGMLIEAARDWNIDLGKSFMIGDRRSDIVAGETVGCYTIFVDRGYREPRPERPDSSAKSLSAAVTHILAHLHINPESDR